MHKVDALDWAPSGAARFQTLRFVMSLPKQDPVPFRTKFPNIDETGTPR